MGRAETAIELQGPEALPDPLVGELLDRYRILERLGEGGMGTVYAVEHIHLRKRMAMKVLRPQLSDNPEVATRFQREALAVGQLRQENIVSVTDFGRTPEGRLYLVMEELRGQTLAAAILDQPGFVVLRARRIAEQIARALEAAHAAGIVHRDLKPANILLIPKEDGEIVKVVDFGISKMGLVERGLTQIGMILGTPEYMSPEQAAGQEVDGRSDIYALGIVLYEMLTGRCPFVAENPLQLLQKQQTEPPPDLAALRPGLVLPAPLRELLHRTLAKRAEDRPQTMAECLALLRTQGPSPSLAAVPPPRRDSPQPRPTVASAALHPRLPALPSGALRLATPEFARFSLTPEEAFLASRLLGAEFVAAELLAVAGMARAKAEALLRGLILRKLIVVAPPHPPHANPTRPRTAVQPPRLASALPRPPPAQPPNANTALVLARLREAQDRTALVRRAVQRAHEHWARGDRAEALRGLRELVEIEPEGQGVPACRALIQRLEDELALTTFQRGRRLDASRDFEGARQAYEQSLSLRPHHPRYLDAVARKLLHGEGESRRALRLSEEAARLVPDDPEIHATLGKAYRQGGRPTEALREFDAALALDARHPFARRQRRKLRWGI